MKVDLANSGNHNVYIDIVDQSGTLVRGQSGTPGEGASIAGGVVEVRNIDANTLELKWSDIVGDNALALYIDKSVTHFVLVQPEHDGDTFPVDRILVLTFSQPVSAANIQAVLQNGTEPMG